jgi:lipopolysaccharide/colanic/teichoic acid biosynthesis glycosyltransferase
VFVQQKKIAIRILDIVGATVVGMMALPLALFVTVVVAISSGFPVLYRSTRAGLGGAPFELIKFRTMRNGVGSDEDRMTPLGAFLRRTSLDEIPELWNVIKGDMSLVGPRPLPVQYVPRYSPQQMRRHEVRPGLTGWAQVNGRNSLSWDEKFSLDIWYVDHQSPLLNIKILLKTLPAVLSRKGVSAPGHATMPEFRPPSHE